MTYNRGTTGISTDRDRDRDRVNAGFSDTTGTREFSSGSAGTIC